MIEGLHNFDFHYKNGSIYLKYVHIILWEAKVKTIPAISLYRIEILTHQGVKMLKDDLNTEKMYWYINATNLQSEMVNPFFYRKLLLMIFKPFKKQVQQPHELKLRWEIFNTHQQLKLRVHLKHLF